MSELNWSTLRKHWADSAAKEPTFGSEGEREAMERCRAIDETLRDMGWNSAIYCPKDGSMFMGWEFPWGSPSLCNYTGEWPTGSFLQYSAGDAWPCSPNLWRPITREEEAVMEEFKRGLR